MKKFLTILIITIFIGCASETAPAPDVDIDATVEARANEKVVEMLDPKSTIEPTLENQELSCTITFNFLSAFLHIDNSSEACTCSKEKMIQAREEFNKCFDEALEVREKLRENFNLNKIGEKMLNRINSLTPNA